MENQNPVTKIDITKAFNISKLSEDELTLFVDIHKKIIPSRKKKLMTQKITKQTSTLCDKILEKAFCVLRSNGIKDFDDKTHHMEFHQRNCGFEKKTFGKWFDWHRDDNAATSYRVYSVLFYIRKDVTVKGGDIDFRIGKDTHTHKINTGDILQFDGNLMHRPQAAGGFGCRDLIVVFIKRK